jgi:hypothetical protein
MEGAKGTGGGLGEARVSPLSSSLSLLGPVAVVSTVLGMSIYVKADTEAHQVMLATSRLAVQWGLTDL